MNYMKKSALVILTSLFLVTSATAFTQGHPLSQILADSGTFADCGDKVLAGNGSCVTLNSGSSGTGTDDQQLEGFTRSGDQVTLSLENGGTANFTDQTGSSGGSGGKYLPDNPATDDVDMNGKSISDLDQIIGDFSIGGTLEGNEINVSILRGGIIESGRWVEAHNFCLASSDGGRDCVNEWSDLTGGSTADGYLPEDSATSNVDMGDNRIKNLAEPEDGTDAATKRYVDAEVEEASGGEDRYLPENPPSNPVDFNDQELNNVGILGVGIATAENVVLTEGGNLCLGGMSSSENCIKEWSDLVDDGFIEVSGGSSGEDRYLPEDDASSNVDMSGNRIVNVESIVLEPKDVSYGEECYTKGRLVFGGSGEIDKELLLCKDDNTLNEERPRLQWSNPHP